MRCLWLTADRPDTAATGGQVYSVGLACALARTGWNVEGLCLGSGDAVQVEGVAWRPVGGDRRRRTSSLLSALPSMTHAVATRRYRYALARRLAAQDVDAVVIDHLQMGWAASIVRRGSLRGGHGPAVVYCSQNHEEAVRQQIARHGPGGVGRRAALHAEALKAARLERRLLRTAELVTCITDADRRSMERHRVGPMVVVSPGYDGSRVAERVIDASTPRRAVLLGSLLWHAKQANLLSFLQAADPLFASVGAEIVVAGATPAGFVERVSPRLRATRFEGFAGDLGALLATARVGIVAEPLGGGFKLKCLDYIFHRVPMAVLSGSVAGLPVDPGIGYLEFPTTDELIRGMLEAFDDYRILNRLQAMAFAACSDSFDWLSRGATLDAALRRVVPGRQGDRP